MLHRSRRLRQKYSSTRTSRTASPWKSPLRYRGVHLLPFYSVPFIISTNHRFIIILSPDLFTENLKFLRFIYLNIYLCYFSSGIHCWLPQQRQNYLLSLNPMEDRSEENFEKYLFEQSLKIEPRQSKPAKFVRLRTRLLGRLDRDKVEY